MVGKFQYVFELPTFALHLKNCYCIVHFPGTFCSFLMTQTGTKFLYVLKVHKSDLQTKINHRIQSILFYRGLQEFKNIYCSFLMIQIGTKFQYAFKLHRSDLYNRISHGIQHICFYRALQKFGYSNVYCFLLKCLPEFHYPEFFLKFNLKFLVLKVHRSAFCTKFSQRIVYRFSDTYVSEDL